MKGYGGFIRIYSNFVALIGNTEEIPMETPKRSSRASLSALAACLCSLIHEKETHSIKQKGCPSGSFAKGFVVSDVKAFTGKRVNSKSPCDC